MSLRDFPVLFKADLIFKYFSRKPSKFKYFSSLCEPCFIYKSIRNINTILEMKIFEPLIRPTWQQLASPTKKNL